MTFQEQSSVSPFKPDCLKGKVALITGGGSGICYEIGRQFLLHGCKGVVICGRREQFLKNASRTLNSFATAAEGSKCVYIPCDVRNPDACIAAVNYCIETFSQLDILVNGAAGNFLAEASSLSPKGFKTVLEIDTMGTFNMSHAAFPYLKDSKNGGGGGCVLNITATLQYGATWFQAHASAAKSAVDSLTRTLALEWGTYNIRVNGIAPGPIENTPGATKLAPGLNAGDVNEMVTEGIPLGRMGKTFDIGMCAIFLCSSAGSYVTGDVLVVDGAQWLYKPPMIPRNMVAELSRKVEEKSRAQVPFTMSSKL